MSRIIKNSKNKCNLLCYSLIALISLISINSFSYGIPIFSNIIHNLGFDFNSNNECNTLNNYINTSGIIIDHIVTINKTDLYSIDNNGDSLKYTKYNQDTINDQDNQEYQDKVYVTNIVYNGVLKIKYKTLPHCIYECNMVLHYKTSNKRTIISILNNYFPTNTNIDLICNNKNCIYTKRNLICNSITINDEL